MLKFKSHQICFRCNTAALVIEIYKVWSSCEKIQNEYHSSHQKMQTATVCALSAFSQGFKQGHLKNFTSNVIAYTLITVILKTFTVKSDHFQKLNIALIEKSRDKKRKKNNTKKVINSYGAMLMKLYYIAFFC